MLKNVLFIPRYTLSLRSRAQRITLLSIALALLVMGWPMVYTLFFIPPDPALIGPAERTEAELSEHSWLFSFHKGCLAWFSPKGTSCTPISIRPSMAIFRATATSPIAGSTTEGTHITLPKRAVRRYAGSRIRITIHARALQEAPSKEFAVAYSTPNYGTSGWIRFKPTSMFADYSFEYDVDAKAADNPDYLGIWADTSGKDRGIIVSHAVITRLP